MKSFSVRCIFKWAFRADQTLKNLYEERITLWKAENFEHAIQLAEEEALEYADDSCEFLGLSQAYAMYDEAVESGIEVFSLLRESDLEAEQYLDAFFDSGFQRARSIK